jgi:choline dehydrogenase
MFDYVVVGAGSAGCVVAAPLGEDRDVRVAVLEAGPPDSEPVIHMPLAFRQLWESRFDWELWSEREPGLGDRRDLLPRGRVLGGSSSLNSTIYMRGNRLDYDGWAAMGFSGWGYEDVLPYFRRSEDNERGESYYHGVGGPLSASGATFTAGLSSAPRSRRSSTPAPIMSSQRRYEQRPDQSAI